MAVYTKLDDLALQALWSVYDDDKALVRAEGIPQGSINTTYRLETEAGVHYLRINEHKTTDEVFYEAFLLERLDAAARAGRWGVVTPLVKKNRVGGRFFHVEERGGRPVWAAVFPQLPGRDLGVFEVTPAHTEQVGTFLARAHGALRDFHGGRANPFGLGTVRVWLMALQRARAEALADDVRAVAARLSSLLDRVARARRPLPRGVIHGDLFVDNTKWHGAAARDGAAREDGPRLAAVFDWEMAGRDHLALDVAITLLAWCWRRDAAHPAGGAFDDAAARALVAGYQRVRPLVPSERRGLFGEALLGAIRFTTSRIRDFEVKLPGRDDASRAFLDYRDFLARLDALLAMGPKGFARMTGLA